MSSGNTLGRGGAEVADAIRGSSRCIVITHRNADPDAIASAVILYRAAEALGCRPCIRLPEGMNSASKRLVEELGIDLEGMACGSDEELEGATLVIVDASNSTQVGLQEEDIKRVQRVILVDHHEPGDLVDAATAVLHEPGAPSTTQLALRILLTAGGRVGADEATLALAGIVYDTRRFLIADRESFIASAALISWGGDYRKVISILGRGKRAEDMDFSERLARLKAAQRVVTGRFCKEYIVAVTHVGSFESSAARALIELGADVAVVVAPRDEEARVSVRVSKRAVEAGVTAAALASYIAEKLGGKGGGHTEAGMAHIQKEMGVNEIVDELAKSIPGKAGRLCVEHFKNAVQREAPRQHSAPGPQDATNTMGSQG